MISLFGIKVSLRSFYAKLNLNQTDVDIDTLAAKNYAIKTFQSARNGHGLTFCSHAASKVLQLSFGYCDS